MNLESLASNPGGLLQPPISWKELPESVKSAIADLPSDLWQKAIDQYSVELHWYKIRQMHEVFIAQVQKTQPCAEDSWQDLVRKHEEHQKLLKWHHYSLHPKEDSNTKTDQKFKLNDIVSVDGKTGKIVGVYWRLWNNPGWSYLVEWDAITGDGNYYQEGAIDAVQ